MNDRLETQCWICPICFDDHSPGRDCKTEDLKEMLQKAQERIRELEKGHQILNQALSDAEENETRIRSSYEVQRKALGLIGKERDQLKAELAAAEKVIVIGDEVLQSLDSPQFFVTNKDHSIELAIHGHHMTWLKAKKEYLAKRGKNG